MTRESCCCVGELNLAGLVKQIWKWCTLNQAGRKTHLGYLNCISRGGQRVYRNPVHSVVLMCSIYRLHCWSAAWYPELLAGKPLACLLCCRTTVPHTFSVYLVPHSQSQSEEGRRHLLEWWRIVFILLKVSSVLGAVMQKSISENRSS